MNKLQLKARLATMSFLEFAIWGAYLISMGMFLGSNGLGNYVFWFYTVQGLVSIFMPALVGIVADRWIPAQKTLAICQLLAGIFMIGTGIVAKEQIESQGTLSFGLVFALYTVSVAFFMPTIGLTNSVSFNGLEKGGLSTVNDFPAIRTMGTVGFICAELFVNFVSIGGETIQHSYTQFYVSGILSICLAAYALTLPACPVRSDGDKKSLVDALGLKAFTLFRRRDMAVFFIFSMLLGVSLQITNSYGSSFIYHFKSILEYQGSWWTDNATFLISISQCSEALCILAIPFFLKRFKIKGVMLMAMFAWVLRFGFFGIGNPDGGVVFLILSCIVYGVAFDFFNVSGGLYVDSRTDVAQRSSAQGLFMLMTNGIGASVGTFLAGTCVVNPLVNAPGLSPEQQLEGWRESWFIFAAYALIVTILFFFIFKENNTATNNAEIKETESTDGGGFVETK